MIIYLLQWLAIINLIFAPSVLLGSESEILNRKKSILIVINVLWAIVVLFCSPSIALTTEFAVLIIVLTLASSALAFFNSIYYAPVVPFILAVVLILGNTAMGRSDVYASRIGEVQSIEQSLFKDTPNNEKRLIPLSMAYDVADKLMAKSMDDGSKYSSTYSINKNSATIQKINGQSYYIFPLDWDSVVRWYKIGSIKGYIKVSANNINDSELVTEINGEPIDIKISYHGYFGNQLNRFISTRLPYTYFANGDKMFIDDSGRPFIVKFILGTKTLTDATYTNGAVVIDPQTGEYTKYAQKDIPKWIDYHYDEETLISSFNDWSEYKNGYIESYSNTTQVHVSKYGNREEMFFIDVDGMDSDTAFFSGVMGENGESLAGMVFIDSQTGSVKLLNIDTMSLSEQNVLSSVSSILGANATTWTVVQPIPYKINNDSVWITPVLSQSNKIVGYGLTKVFGNVPSVFDKDLSVAIDKLFYADMDRNLDNTKIETKQIDGYVRSVMPVGDSTLKITLADSDGNVLPMLLSCDMKNIDSCAAIITNDYVILNVIERAEHRAGILEYVNSPVF